MGRKRVKRSQLSGGHGAGSDDALVQRQLRVEGTAGVLKFQSSDAQYALASWWLTQWKQVTRSKLDAKGGNARDSILEKLCKLANAEHLWEQPPLETSVSAADWGSLFSQMKNDPKYFSSSVYTALSMWMQRAMTRTKAADSSELATLVETLTCWATCDARALVPLLAYFAGTAVDATDDRLQHELRERSWSILTADTSSMAERLLATEALSMLAIADPSALLYRALDALHELEERALSRCSETPEAPRHDTDDAEAAFTVAIMLRDRHRALSRLVAQLLRHWHRLSEAPLHLPARHLSFRAISEDSINVYNDVNGALPLPLELWLHVRPAWHQDILLIWEASLERFGVATLPVVTKWLTDAVRCCPGSSALHRLLYQACCRVGIAAAPSVERYLVTYVAKRLTNLNESASSQTSWCKLIIAVYRSPAACAMLSSGITQALAEALRVLLSQNDVAFREQKTWAARALVVMAGTARDAHALEWVARRIQRDRALRHEAGALFEALSHPRGFPLESFATQSILLDAKHQNGEQEAKQRPAHGLRSTSALPASRGGAHTDEPDWRLQVPGQSDSVHTRPTADAALASDQSSDLKAAALLDATPSSAQGQNPLHPETLFASVRQPTRTEVPAVQVSCAVDENLYDQGSMALCGSEPLRSTSDTLEDHDGASDSASASSIEALVQRVVDASPSPSPSSEQWSSDDDSEASSCS